MAMQLHEVHPSLIHLPLALLPAAATLDVMAVTSARRPRRWALDMAGRRLWWAGAGGALVAGLAGMAASQEIRLDDPRARDAMWLHGVGNVAVLIGAAGLATWRSGHRATAVSAGIGTAAVGFALYTAWLGGSLVYTHGAGVKALTDGAHAGTADSPPLLSASAPWRLLRDSARGLAWLFTRGGRLATRREHLAEGAATRASELPMTLGQSGGRTGVELGTIP